MEATPYRPEGAALSGRTLVAAKTGDPHLLSAADSSYVHGMGIVLLVCFLAALVTALLAAALLPKTEPAGPAPGDVAPAAPDAGQ